MTGWGRDSRSAFQSQVPHMLPLEHNYLSFLIYSVNSSSTSVKNKAKDIPQSPPHVLSPSPLFCLFYFILPEDGPWAGPALAPSHTETNDLSSPTQQTIVFGFYKQLFFSFLTINTNHATIPTSLSPPTVCWFSIQGKIMEEAES